MLSKKGKRIELTLAVILILVGAGLRLVPHPPNFAPIAAIALFAGVYMSRQVALFLPIAAMVVSDIFIGYYDFKLMAVVYSVFLLTVVLGFWLKRNKKWYAVLGSSLLAGFLFFLITNFAVWVLTPWYSKTLSGLVYCYFLALPFFKNTLAGNLFYVVSFFGLYEAAKHFVKKRYSVPKFNLVS